MNVYDSQRIASILETLGYQPTDHQNQADIVIFNTCHIREKAAEKVFSDLGRAELIKQERATVVENGFLERIIPQDSFNLAV